ncbi:porin [Cesiribacter sp. SM1]|uniref:porin n=1 Tax=Cesiribacter sp. SM1 TaxID=2861196 RepID=UPI001CD3A696|nr:porin [Cesiribacter sp. SM1]
MISAITKNIYNAAHFSKAVVLLGALCTYNTDALFAQEQEVGKDSASIWKKMQEPKALKADGKKIEITQSLQLWNVYTFESLGEQEQESRNDLYIRRGRLGVKGKLQENIAFNVAFAYDGIGRDKETAGNGSPNPDDNHDFFLWEAFVAWTHKPMLNLAAGYFRPQVGREHMTAAFKTPSFEKSLSNFQPRAHTIARGTGRELGLNLGGLHKASGWSFNYNIGLFDMSGEKLTGDGAASLPMLASRVAFTLGDPEMEKWGLGYTHSYYGKRKGITLGLNSTYQGETQVFKRNSFYGADLLANWGGWDFTVEYDWLYRNSFLPVENSDLDEQQTASTTDKVYTYKLGYNFELKNGKVLQAAAMYSGQQASEFGDTWGQNSLTGATDQKVYDVGLNYLLNKDKLKLSMHYVWGDRMDKTPEHRYAYLGTGFQYLF